MQKAGGKEDEEGEGWRKLVMSLGRHGGFGGDEWDDGVFSSVKQVEISYGYGSIDSIRTEYEDSGWSDRHGGNGGDSTVESVVLEYPDEYLISIHGYMGEFSGLFLIRSLTFESNKRIYGPFGEEEGTRFWFPTTTPAKIVGFHGTAGWHLDSIGIKVVPILNNTTTTIKTLN